MNTQEGQQKKSVTSAIEEDVKSSNSHCISYLIKDRSKAKKVDDMRQKLRMRGLRCHLMYFVGPTRMQVIPLLGASRHRYSGIFLYAEIERAVEEGSENLLSIRSYLREDVVPPESPQITYTHGNETVEEFANALRQVSRLGT
ncbi:hypothetical protein HAX54_037638 [Datura stramonium]|uniref:Uncharacterized protein n=1 Tax=Datura stramonium TaxID=4076 RepID=A0ABS8VJZ9_DATST|nr:hypothetical protein [Datura stramonium]